MFARSSSWRNESRGLLGLRRCSCTNRDRWATPLTRFRDYADVFRRGVLEVGKLLQGVKARPGG